MSKVDHSELRIYEVLPLQSPKSQVIHVLLSEWPKLYRVLGYS